MNARLARTILDVLNTMSRHAIAAQQCNLLNKTAFEEFRKHLDAIEGYVTYVKTLLKKKGHVDEKT